MVCAGELSRGAAKDGSPRREPWGRGENHQSPVRGDRTDTRGFLSPLRGSGLLPTKPTARAVGYRLALFRSFHRVIKSLFSPKAGGRKSGLAHAGFSPERRKGIAQRGNAGVGRREGNQSRQGRKRACRPTTVLSSLTGLERAGREIPALKRWAMLFRPAGLKPA